jgi:enoyl-CoA hydratase/carnithine racemase
MSAYQDYECLRISAADGICRATIDHPPINLLDLDLILELGRLATEVAADEQVRVLIVDSADPDFFIAHADLKLIQMMPTDDTSFHDGLSPFHATVELFRTMPKATIAVIEGIARGGGSETALSFDMRFAALGKARLSRGFRGRRCPPHRTLRGTGRRSACSGKLRQRHSGSVE